MGEGGGGGGERHVRKVVKIERGGESLDYTGHIMRRQ